VDEYTPVSAVIAAAQAAALRLAFGNKFKNK
jgi:hypothetical protein